MFHRSTVGVFRGSYYQLEARRCTKSDGVKGSVWQKLLSRQLEKRRKLVWHARSNKLPVNFSSQPRTNVSRIVAPSSGVCARVSAAPRGFNLRHGCDCATRRVSAGSSRFVNSQFCGSPHESNNRASPPRLRPSPHRRLPTPVDWKERKTIVSHRFDAIDC